MATPNAEVAIDAELVAALLADQHPDLAGLEIEAAATGWDNAVFRLGDDLAVRLPRRLLSSLLIVHEQRWLPELAPHLPLQVPSPVRIGAPGEIFPWAWSVVPWIPGDPAEHTRPSDLGDAAETLGGFLAALHRPAPPDAPRNPYRGVPLDARDQALRDGLETLDESIDAGQVVENWERARVVEPWPQDPVWLHGDVHPLNLLVEHGRLHAVIDFGDVCAGDPASDLAVAWMFFDDDARARFRRSAAPAGGVDDATWCRAWGWAIALGVALAGGDDRVRAIGLRTLHTALADDPIGR